MRRRTNRFNEATTSRTIHPMKKQLLRAAALLAVAVTTASSGLAQPATTTYSPGDLFLGLRQTGAANSLAVKIGPATQFLPASLGGTISNNAPFKVQFGVLPGSSFPVFNLNTDLASVFSSSWTNNPTNGSGVRWAVVGQTDDTLDNTPIDGLKARSIFVTRARISPSVPATPLIYGDTQHLDLFAQQFVPFAYGTGGGAYVNNFSTVNSSAAFIGSATAVNDWNTKIQENGSFGLGASRRVEQAILGSFTGPTDSVLDLFLAPRSGSSLATSTRYLGSFTLYKNGELIYWPDASNAPAPVVNVAVSPINGSVGTLFQYQISASNFPSAYGAANLPDGLTVNADTGLISGTPTAAGTNNVVLSATNPFGSGSNSLTLVFALPASPAILSAATANGQVGQPFSYQISASGNPTSYSATPLPPGLTVNTNTGLISGTPTTAGSSPVSISASNDGGTGTADLQLTIAAAPISVPVINSAATANGRVGQPFSYQITASGNPTSYAATSLPRGLTLNPNTGRISGTPTTAGSSTVSISASNAGGPGAARVLTINRAKGTQRITFAQPSTQKFRKGRTFNLAATANSRLTVTFVSSNPEVISVRGKVATIRGIGKAKITARQAGNANYAPAANVVRTVTVRK